MLENTLREKEPGSKIKAKSSEAQSGISVQKNERANARKHTKEKRVRK